MKILKNFFGRLFYAFTQIIWRIGVFQVNLQLSKLPMGFLTTLGKGARLILHKKLKNDMNWSL